MQRKRKISREMVHLENTAEESIRLDKRGQQKRKSEGREVIEKQGSV